MVQPLQLKLCCDFHIQCEFRRVFCPRQAFHRQKNLRLLTHFSLDSYQMSLPSDDTFPIQDDFLSLKPCVMFVLNYRNTSDSLGEQEMLWEHEQ